MRKIKVKWNIKMRLYFAAFFFFFFCHATTRSRPPAILQKCKAQGRGRWNLPPDPLETCYAGKGCYTNYLSKEKKEILSVVEPRLLRRCCGCTLPADPKPQCIFFPHNHRNHPERDYYKFVSNIRHFRAASLILNHRLKRSRFVVNWSK